MSDNTAPMPPESIWTRPLPLISRRQSTAAKLVAQADLPAPIANLILTICNRSRLWRSEKIETARELIAHFQDGLAAGHTADQLTTDFGDPAAAAKLIRRATKRKRSILWKAWVYSWLALGACMSAVLLIALFITARYFVGSPNIARNFAAEINAPILATPEQDRAWTYYARALDILAPLGAVPVQPLDPGERPSDRDARPGDPVWPQVLAYLDKARPGLELIHVGAEKPIMGYPLSDAVNPEVQRQLHSFENPLGAPMEESKQTIKASENPFLIGVLLPHLSAMRSISRVLVLYDVPAATEAGDPIRAERDIRTVTHIAEQCCKGATIIEQLVGLALLNMATESLRDSLATYPAFLPDEALIRLSHQLASFRGGGRIIMNFSGDRLMMDDLVQRLYTDDGAGDGHLCRGGIAQLERDARGDIASFFGVPGSNYAMLAGLSASRRELTEEWNRWYDRAAAEARLPLWERDGSTMRDLDRSTRSIVWKSRFMLISILIPALDSTTRNAEIATMHRDATLAACAAELHHRRTGSYPATLESLVPKLLPAIPIDCWSGKPLRYRLENGKPLLYSLSWNKADDNGTPWNSVPNTKAASDEVLWRVK